MYEFKGIYKRKRRKRATDPSNKSHLHQKLNSDAFASHYHLFLSTLSKKHRCRWGYQSTLRFSFHH